MDLSTVTEWVGSAIISNLVDMAFTYLGERKLPANTEAELDRLKALLPKITAVMSVAEALKYKYQHKWVHAWLEKFRLAFQAAEDALDELEYHKLKDKVNNQDQVGGSSTSTAGWFKRKFPFGSTSNINSDTLGRLEKAVRMLDEASKDVGDLFQLATGLDFWADKVSSRETGSLLTESKVVGRGTEKAKIIKWLKKAAHHTPISAVCIFGPGGLGKTTLAQLICEEMSREKYFDKTIWICVSTQFSVKDITRKMLKQLDERTDGGESLDDLQKKLKEKVHSMKVLLILDDVWKVDEMHEWEKLVAPLKFVKQGSKILLTTRMEQVADMLVRVLNVEREYLNLKGIENQQLLPLLNKYAFQGYNPDDHRDLQQIGNEIVKKLWGSPLAAKVVGGLLNSKMNFHYWKRILKCNTLINLEEAKEVADVLKLSYFHLSADLQQCFRFCSIFSQDFEFEKDKLIRMWMASGFIRQQSCIDHRPEDIGEDYFNHLLRKSFFEPNTRYNDENQYVMHDLMHELAQNVSQGECFRVDPNSNSIEVPSTAQHVSVPCCEIERISQLRNLFLTLVITEPCCNRMPDFDKRFVLPNKSLKETLRVLVMHRDCSVDLPEKIDHLIHLRYLSSHVVSGKLLYNSINKLYHLQALELEKSAFESFDSSSFNTNGMSNLVSLRHMKLPDEIMKNIYGVHKLTALQGQLTFFVGQDNGRHIDELKTLNNLQDLCINQIENVGDSDQAKNANLSKKKNLLSLSLNWTARSNSDNPEQIIDNLQPHLNLRKLEIHFYKGQSFPNWMRDLPYLKELSLYEMSEVKEANYSFDTRNNACTFPSMEVLKCKFMPKWQSWTGLFSTHDFPNLKFLEIIDCPNLAELPAIPLSLSYFIVVDVGLNSLPDIYHISSGITKPAPSSPKSSLIEVEIRDCPNLKSLGFLQQEDLDFQAMERLSIINCGNMEPIPTGGFGRFVSVKSIEILRCPKLVPVNNPIIFLPLKLQELKIGDCGDLDVILLEAASQLTKLDSLYITDSANITCIPWSENAFASLRKLDITGCDKLVQQSLMEIAQNVNPRNSTASSKISVLTIPHHSLLFVEPFISQRSVTECRIMDGPGIEALPEQWLMQNSSTLKILDIYKASSLQSLPDTMVRLTALIYLTIWDATLLEKIPELPPSLGSFRIYNASSLRSLPDTMVRLTALDSLAIHNAPLLEKIPELPPSLGSFDIYNASSLRSLPDTMVRLTGLRSLTIHNAPLLEKIPELPPLVRTDITDVGGRPRV